MHIADRRTFIPVAALFAATVVFSAPLVCQVPYAAESRGAIVGHVIDTTKNPISGAQVVVARQGDSVIVATGVTDGQGVARLGRVAPGGPYNVLVRQIGYAPARDTAVYVRDGQVVELSFVLSPQVVTLPEVTVRDPRERLAFVPKLVHHGGFFGIRLLGCLYIGLAFSKADLDRTDELIDGCTRQRLARAAKKRAREDAALAKEAEKRRAEMAKLLAKAEARYVGHAVFDAARRVDSATSTGARPDSADAFLVADAATVCGPERPADDTEAICHEVLKRTPRARLGRLAERLDALDGPAPGTAQAAPPSRDSTQHWKVAPILASPASPSATLVDFRQVSPVACRPGNGQIR